VTTINSQISDAVSTGIIETVNTGPSVAMSMTYSAMADSIGMLMHNAVTTQFNGQTIAVAALTQSCALILAKGSSG